MSHTLDRLAFFTRKTELFSDGHGVMNDDDRTWEEAYRSPLAARQDRPLDPRRELHGLLLVEDLRQGRDRHLGDPADRLSAHAAGTAEPRAARLRPGRQLQLVSLLGQPGEVPAGPLAPAATVAQGARDPGAGGGLGLDPGRSGAPASPTPACAARAASCAPTGTRSPRSSQRPTPIPSSAGARTGCSASRRSRPCRWSPTPPARAICSCSAGSAARSTTGTATCRRPRPRPGANRPTSPRAPTGTIPASCCCGAPTSRRPARRTPTSTPRPAIAAPSRWSSARTIRRPRSSPTCGCR